MSVMPPRDSAHGVVTGATPPATPLATLMLSVHGPAGSLDLVVPAGATGLDVARAYAREGRLPTLPHLYDAAGGALPAHDVLGESGVRPGAVLVAVPGGVAPAVAVEGTATAPPSTPPSVGSMDGSGPVPVRAALAASAGSALLAGWWAGVAGGAPATVSAVVLVLTALLALAPWGPHVGERAVTAPAYAAAAALAVAWQPGPEALPVVVGVAALSGAATAAVARAWCEVRVEALEVWMVTGVAVFGVAGAAALLGLPPAVVWSLLLAAAVVAARSVPSLAVDVPDEVLLDLDRLAVTAWSARDTRESRRSRRSRSLVTHEAVSELVARGSRLVGAAGVAVATVAALGSSMLLLSVAPGLDRIGAVVQVLLSAPALLLAARGQRHPLSRAMLRTAGLLCGAALLAAGGHRAVIGGGPVGEPALLGLAVAAVLLGALSVVAAVATGRGRRSTWWSRRADQAEAAVGAGALAAVVVAVGLFRLLWETTS